ncbi:glycosyltransferase family 39 protein [Anaerolineales bacterium HSG6]|nr:glycosyltransferase family 39 protein [Anaerolineales bacterium HSG6]
MKNNYLPLILAILTGFFVRVVSLNHLPLSLSLDEATNGLDAWQLYNTAWLTPFLNNNFGRETLFFYLQSLVFQTIGISIFSLRWLSVLAGTVTIPLLYRVGVRLSGRPFVGLLAAIGLAVSYWHLYFSRVGLRAILLLPFLLTMIYCFWRGWFSESRLIAKASISDVPPCSQTQFGNTIAQANSVCDLQQARNKVSVANTFPIWRLGTRRLGTRRLGTRRLGTRRLGTRGLGTGGGERLLPKPSYLWLVGAGALLGLSFYTYLAARLLPFLFGSFIVIEIFIMRLGKQADKSPHVGTLRAQFLKATAFFLPAFFLSLPLLLYFWQTPHALNSRAGAISILTLPDPFVALSDNLSAIAYLHLGYGRWLAAWPSLNPLTCLGLLVGLPVVIFGLKRSVNRFLLLWWLTGLIPLFFSIHNWSGETTILRAIIAWPVIYLLAAVGWTKLSMLIQTSTRRSWSAGILPAPHVVRTFLVTCYLIFATLFSGYNYFHLWATNHNDFSDHPPYLAAYLNQQGEIRSVLPLKFYGETVAHFLLKARYPQLQNVRDDLTLFANQPTQLLLPPNQTVASDLVLLDPTTQSAYLLPSLSLSQTERMADYVTQATPQHTVLDREDEPILTVYPLSDDVSRSFLSIQPVSESSRLATFADAITLRAMIVEPTQLAAGDIVTIQLDWQTQRRLTDSYHLFIHLFDVTGRQRWGQLNQPLTGLLFDAYRWPQGLTIPDRHQFQLPPDAPAGPYRFEIGLYHPVTQARLPVALDDKLITGKFHVGAPPVSPQYPLPDVQFGGQMVLQGLDIDRSSLSWSTGEALRFVVHWQALSEMEHTYTIFAHLLDDTGQIKAQFDTPPQQGNYPTNWWDVQEIVLDPYSIPLSPELPSGLYSLRLGVYNSHTGQRLLLNDLPQDYYDLPYPITIE